jgi:FAD:protein FMN transferase
MTGICSRTFRSLGTGCTVLVEDDTNTGVADAIVRRYIERIDLACSRFRDDSELTLLTHGQGRWQGVSPLLFEALVCGLRAAELTDGLLDPTIGNALFEFGYDRDFDAIVDTGPIVKRFVALAGWKSIELDHLNLRVRVPAGTVIDLGATAKALAADNAAKSAASATGVGVLVNLGGDIATSGPAPEGGWQVGIAESHATSADDVDMVVALYRGGLATSSTSVRRWMRGSQSVHHIVDPRTMRSVDSVWTTASVFASTCVDANIASTTAIILGFDAPEWLLERNLDARLVSGDGSVMTVGNWPVEVRA